MVGRREGVGVSSLGDHEGGSARDGTWSLPRGRLTGCNSSTTDHRGMLRVRLLGGSSSER